MTKAKVLCILNHKGGVGKTTTTINLGGALQQKGYKVLLIDLDGQANLTESMGLSAELPQTIYGAMKGEYPLPIYHLHILVRSAFMSGLVGGRNGTD